MRGSTVPAVLTLATLALAGLANGMATDVLPVWRQLLYPTLAVLVYLHGRHLSVRRGELVMAAVGVVGVVIAAVRVWEGVGALASLGLFVVLPWLAGRFRRQQAELIAVGRERIVQLERAQELVAERARLRERARIAADMHDSLGHELALIALRAGAMELTADTEPTRRAAAGLRESAVTAAERLRHTVGVLREGVTTSFEPPDETVRALVARAAEAGLPVVLTGDLVDPTGDPAAVTGDPVAVTGDPVAVTGDPVAVTGDTTPLPPLVDRAVHRVVQEALTNAARHAPDAPVTVHLALTTDDVRVTVTNPVDQVPPPGDGSGLAGLAERVRLLGGTLRSGVDDGRFTVTARLPREGGA